MMSHSLDWINARTLEISERRGEEERGRTAAMLNAVALGTAAGMGSEEAGEALQEWFEQLTATREEEDHFLNPNAETDMEALKASGMYRPGVTNG